MTTDVESSRARGLAALLARLREQYPTLGDEYWQELETKTRLQWRIDDLTAGLARLAGAYGWHAEQHPDNTLLAELVASLGDLVERSQQ